MPSSVISLLLDLVSLTNGASGPCAIGTFTQRSVDLIDVQYVRLSYEARTSTAGASFLLEAHADIAGNDVILAAGPSVGTSWLLVTGEWTQVDPTYAVAGDVTVKLQAQGTANCNVGVRFCDMQFK